MPRKSAALRLQQTQDLLKAYEAAGLGNEYNCRFIRDMANRLARAKYPTKRQRDWLDSLIEEGVPAPKGDQEYIAKIDEAIATEGIDFGHILTDFRGKLVRGWDLSEKQKAWCDNLIQKAEDIRSGNYWRPDEATTERLRRAVEVSVCYNNMYWSTHGGMASAISKVKAWVAGDLKIIDEWSVEKALKAVAGRLREIENPKFNVGDKCFLQNRKWNDETNQWSVTSDFGIVMSEPYVSQSSVVYDILVGAEIVTTSNARKRR